MRCKVWDLGSAVRLGLAPLIMTTCRVEGLELRAWTARLEFIWVAFFRW